MRYQSTAVAIEERNDKNPPKFFAYGELKGEYICVVKIARKNSISTQKKM